jgi:hypothetical protein
VERGGPSAAAGVQVSKDVSNNDVKKLITKRNNGLYISDVAERDAVVVRTHGEQRLQMLDACKETGKRIICLETDGDIFLNAPNGRVHIRCKFFSREVGDPQEG